jgi:hypothetical protein
MPTLTDPPCQSSTQEAGRNGNTSNKRTKPKREVIVHQDRQNSTSQLLDYPFFLFL